MCEELGRMCACISRRVRLYKWAGTGVFFVLFFVLKIIELIDNLFFHEIHKCLVN